MNKYYEAVKSKTFFSKAKKKLHYDWRASKKNFHLTNNDVKSFAFQCYDYDLLFKKYKKVILNGTSIPTKHIQSNRVWVCWFQGYENAPSLVKACINSIYKCMPEREITILTISNFTKYIDLPDYILKKFHNGKIGMAHFSDLLRISILAKWGGMWIDSTALCTDSSFFKFVSKQPLFVFKQLNLSNKDNAPIVASNWFISCEIGNPIIELTKNLLLEYWKDYDYAINYFIFHLFFAMSCRRYCKEWEDVPTFNNNSPHVLMFELKNNYSIERWKQITEMSSIHKLQRYDDYSDLKQSNYSKILEMYL